MIRIVPYDDSWPDHFASEASQLRAAMGSLALRIEHVGSTSVPGLAAKPVIDIQISVATLDGLGVYWRLSLARLQPRTFGDIDLAYPSYASRRGPITRHIHLCVIGSEYERRHRRSETICATIRKSRTNMSHLRSLAASPAAQPGIARAACSPRRRSSPQCCNIAGG